MFSLWLRGISTDSRVERGTLDCLYVCMCVLKEAKPSSRQTNKVFVYILGKTKKPTTTPGQTVLEGNTVKHWLVHAHSSKQAKEKHFY